MTTVKYKEFENRIKRVEKAHAKGRGFEAPGTYGRAHNRRRAEHGILRGLLHPTGIFILMVLGIKTAMAMHLGTDHYESKLDHLRSASMFGQVSAYILQPDPVSRWSADLLQRSFKT